MPPLNIGGLRAVAAKLDPTGLNYAFTGGSVVNLLIDHPDFSPARATDDVDVIVGGRMVKYAERDAGIGVVV
jgi:hypothetical protein